MIRQQRKHYEPSIRGSVILGFACIFFIFLTTSPGFGQGLNGDRLYTSGPDVCAKCHQEAYNDWLAHGHSRKLVAGPWLNKVAGESYGLSSNARLSGFILPDHDTDVYNWDNVLFIIGGSKYWKSRYVDLTGHVITKNGKNQYNWEDGSFSDYHKDEVKPFSCGSCHTTGYDENGTAFPNTPGIVGDFAHFNITCEACHGPGQKHANSTNKDDIVVDKSAELCGKCHTRGNDPNVIIAKGGFIRHHEQYPEFLSSEHSLYMDCTTCHNPHLSRAKGIKVAAGQSETCETCHLPQVMEYTGSTMQKKGVTCQDCHMGKATKSAIANGPFEGDVQTHIWKINSDRNYTMFYDNGTKAKDALSLEFACFPCHADADKSDFASIGTTGTDYHMIR